ncbi:MAG: alanine:cation symporter family protein [Myxococcales bacterium]|nr:alanine:cation symporter family protein [Myxococcales bacterium]
MESFMRRLVASVLLLNLLFAGPVMATAPAAQPAAAAAKGEADSSKKAEKPADKVAASDAAKTDGDVHAENAKSLEKTIDGAFGGIVGVLATVMFWEIPGLKMPFVVAWLAFGAVFFTLRMTFVNIRMFTHAISVVRGRFDDPNEPGEVSHFQALSSALSATVGLGNIAGVAVAVMAGGPGAVFWMVCAAAFGMTSKFTECTLGVKYRITDANGAVSGGPMQYLSAGLQELGLGPIGKVLAGLFAILCIGGSFGGGNMFQVGQSYGAISEVLPFELSKSVYGLTMAALVGVVIIGGIQSIARVAEKIVPAMVSIYVIAALFVLISHAGDVPSAFGRIVGEAFNPKAGFGGLLGVLVQGVRRAAFSNEAGVGSASIAHAAAKTDEPVREGIVALLEPFIDTILVCTMTGLVIVITGVAEDPANAQLVADKSGAALTAVAFGSVISWFPKVLAICVLLFAYSTMISWSYYGERCFTYLFGAKSSLTYKIMFLIMVYVGAVSSMSNALDFSDLMILGMAFPNIIGLLALSGKVKKDLDHYVAKLKAGEFKTFK